MFLSTRKKLPEFQVQVAQASLLDLTIILMEIKNDVELARLLGIASSTISRIRNGHRSVGSLMLLNIHELTEIPLDILREVSTGKYGTNIFDIMKNVVENDQMDGSIVLRR